LFVYTTAIVVAACSICFTPYTVLLTSTKYPLLHALFRHVINNADDVTVTMLDQSVYNAKVPHCCLLRCVPFDCG